MSSKSDNDNRSNQMNPNNDVYFSSRSGSAGDDDEAPSRRVTHFSFSPEPDTYAVNNYYLAYLCLTGEQRAMKLGIKIQTYRLFGDGRSECDDWAIRIHQEIINSLSHIWTEPFALCMIADKYGKEFSWESEEYSPNHTYKTNTPSPEKTIMWKLNCQKQIESLRKEIAAPENNTFQDWGVFSVAGKLEHSSLKKFRFKETIECLLAGLPRPDIKEDAPLYYESALRFC